jgi:hypothetical protein
MMVVILQRTWRLMMTGSCHQQQQQQQQQEKDLADLINVRMLLLTKMMTMMMKAEGAVLVRPAQVPGLPGRC